jgi:phosphoglycolate phosphatase-like HAD superfamily hydrolase
MPKVLEMERELNPEFRRILKKAIAEFSTSVDGDDIRKQQIKNTLDRVIMRGMPLDAEAQQLLSVLVEATTAMQKLSEDDEWRRQRRRRIE